MDMNHVCPVTGEHRCKCVGKHDVLEQPTLKETLRKLFTDHGHYDHAFSGSTLDRLPNAPALEERLMLNQDEIGEALGKYVGVSGGRQVTALLKEHIALGKEAVLTLMAGRDLNPVVARIMDNAERTGTLFYSINPNVLNQQGMIQHFKVHSNQALDLAKLHKAGRFVEEIKLFDAFIIHLLNFSDLIYWGLSRR